MITIDPRVGSVELETHLRRLNYPIELEMMTAGDFAFIGEGPEGPIRIGIERKRLTDLISSLKSGRLAGHQAILMAEQYEVRYLLVEGIYKVTPHGEIHIPGGGGRWFPIARGRLGHMLYTDLVKWLTTLEHQAGLTVRHTSGPEQSALLITALYDWWQKPWADHQALHQMHTGQLLTQVGMSKPSLLRRIAAQLDGIGWEKSKAVESHFATVLDMADATEKQWQQIPGIGKTLARRIIKALQCPPDKPKE